MTLNQIKKKYGHLIEDIDLTDGVLDVMLKEGYINPLYCTSVYLFSYEECGETKQSAIEDLAHWLSYVEQEA